MKAWVTGLLAALGCLTVALPAQAAPIAYTITGTIIDGNDAKQLFGGSTHLAGTAFTVVETFDPAKAQSAWSNAGGSGATGNDVGFASVALTIGDVTRRFAGQNGSLSSQLASQFTSNVQNGLDQIGFAIASTQIKADYTLENTIDGLVDRYGGQYTLNDASGVQIVYANFEINGLKVVSAVPLPASAPLFGAALLGLAAMGIRQRATTAFAPGRQAGRPAGLCRSRREDAPQARMRTPSGSKGAPGTRAAGRRSPMSSTAKPVSSSASAAGT